MFRNKKELDRHVQDILRKVKSENERNQRCYNIAQQYYRVRDYESAKHYLSLYLSWKDDSPAAYKLQGQIWEGIGDKVRALTSYKTSLEYEANQPELVLKMCQLLGDTDVAMEVDRAHYWCERAADLFPHDPAVFRLKEKLLKLGGGSNTCDFEDLINSEMKARPNDVVVRTRLMRLYLETGRTKAAYSHALEVEASQTFLKQLQWYECFAQICQAYSKEFPSQTDWQFYCNWVSVLDKVASLSMCELAPPKKITECIHAIFSMDQTLHKAGSVSAPKDHSELYKQFLRHMSAQLCLHIATVIFKKAKKEPSGWREATRAVSPVLFLALTSPPDSEAPWCQLLKLPLKQAVARWTSDAYYRISQAGYTLLSLAKEAGNQFTEKVTHMATGNWRERTYQRVFTVLDQRANMATSHFVTSDLLAKVSVRLPTHDSGFLKTRQLMPVYEQLRGDLHHLVWLGLETARHNRGQLPPELHTYSFTRLRLATNNMSNMSVETLCVLDVDAFLYATILCASAILEDEVSSGLYSSDRPTTLPADICNLLCTHEQMSWWTSAVQVNSQQFSEGANLVSLRQQLQRGLEVVRVDGNHGLDVQLIVRLARTFADRAASVVGKKEEQAALESRALLYWNTALPLLERMERNQTVQQYNSKLFEYPRKELSTTEIGHFLEEGRYFIACQLMKSEQFEQAVEAFKSLRTPYASFNQALIYKKLAAAELEERPREEITSEMRSRHVILLTKARDCLNLTFERIRADRQHALHSKLPEHMDQVEAALSRIEPENNILFGTAMSVDFSVQHLGNTYQSSNLNRSVGEVTEPSVSSVQSPSGAGDMGMTAIRLNGHTSSTPQRNPRQHTRYTSITPENRRQNAELIDVGQLLQIQALHDELKKIHSEQKRLSEDQKKMNEKLDMLLESMNDLMRDKMKATGAEDLYLFGEEEEYPEDVLGGQYPPFVPSYPAAPQPAPTFYPTTPRGVQGKSTVTYGAPPPAQPAAVIPFLQMRMPLDPTLAGFQTPQNLALYNQGTLPFSEPQHLPDFLRQNIPKPVIPPQPQAPVNVVITTSDTLPTGPPPVQPTLSVTIPPQHRLGTLPPASNTPPAPTPVSTTTTPPPHKFQIPMPSTATTPNMEKSPIGIPEDLDSEDEKETEHDPYPDFKPIIPLPNEVSVTTGEEDDDTLFESRAKLFRFVNKEWKERGVGTVKILKNRNTDKVRLLMRRDQVHKICANHLLKSDMELTWMKNSDRALIWVANDFAEEVVQIEKFCMKFKTAEDAIKFKDVFNDAKMKYGQSPQKPKEDKDKTTNTAETKQLENTAAPVKDTKQQDAPAKVNLGGFTFTSTPKLTEPISEKLKQVEETKKEPQSNPSPFAGFSFTPQKPATSLPSSTSLFAGLNNTQNKHNLFEDINNDTYEDSGPIISNEVAKKPILKQPILASVPTTQTSQPTSKFNFTTQPASATSTPPKEIPKSILKETPTNIATTPENTRASPSTKHVLFQEMTPSQQTPTLSALLTSPKTSVLDFAALSKINENKTPQFETGKSKAFEGAGTPVFGGQSAANRSRNDSEGEPAEDFVPSAEFKPVIPLPELVEVKTGEEGQEVLFDERAKLMRFDPTTKEWKERGLGQMKILKDPVNGITRFLMRREQVHKVCCNHRIIQSMELKPSTSSEKAWTWYAVDYAEGEMKNELLAIRFKTVELAKQFKETVDNVQRQLREESTSKRSCPDTSPQPSNTTNVTKLAETDTMPKLSELYRPKAGSWECKACYTVNGAKDNTCVCCDSPKEKPKSPAASPAPHKTKETTSGPSLAELFRPKAGNWECKACYTDNTSKDNTCKCCDSPKEKPKSSTASPAPHKTKETTSGQSLAEMFKPKAGSWECGGCLVRNEADKTICPACSTPKPGHENDAKEPPKSGVSFGSTSFSFGIKPEENKTGFSFGVQNENPAKSLLSFGVKPAMASEATQSLASAKPADTVSNPTTGFSFGITTPSKPAVPFTFAPKSDVVSTSADTTTPSTGVKESTPFKFGGSLGKTETPSKASFMFGGSNLSTVATDPSPFGGPGKYEFSFSGVKACKSPGSQSGGRSPRSPGSAHGQDSDSDTEEVDDEEGDHIIFQPVVPLPDKVPLTTGEEEEEVLYSHRAKLYRFAQGEWKERGVGDIKMLRHNDTHKIRFLMRREPILKICLNHYLTAEIAFTPKDDRSWLWSAQDFAEGQLSVEQFCLRFKTPEIAAEFKAAVDSAQGELAGSVCQGSSAPGDEHDVEIVYEASVSEELRKKALELKLPPNFYGYLDASPCPGCRGCEPDSEEDESLKKTSVQQPTKLVPNSVSKSNTTTVTTVSQPFVFTVKTTSETRTTESAATATATATVQPFSMFSLKTTTPTTAAVSLLSTPSSQPSVTTPSSQPNFTFSLGNSNTGTTSFRNATQTNSLFDTTVSEGQTPGKSIFGGTPFFGNTTPKSNFSFESKPSIFGGSDSPKSPPSVVSSSNSGSMEKGSPFFANLGSSPASVFGTSSTQSQSVFGTPTTQAESIFDLLPLAPNSVFRNRTPTTQSQSVFGTSTTQSQSVFNTPTTQSQSFFGTSTTQSQSVFSTPTTQSQSIFGSSTTQSKSFFSTTTTQSQSIFGTSTTQSKSFFSTPTTQSQSVFGSSFQSGAPLNATTDNGPSFLFKSTTTFSDLAATTKPAFGSESGSNFSWAGAGSVLFGGKQPKPKKEDSEGEGEESEGEGDADANHDPVFEPIVPLPDVIEVRTGEEDEEKVFCQRAKLYRYDAVTKEWKERGTGDMKILHHSDDLGSHTYRFLLRRDQVHKVVCNQLITPDMGELQRLSNSDTSYCWYGMNMAEEYSEPRLEQLAVKFKNSEIAQSFKQQVEEAVKVLKASREYYVVEEEPVVTIEEVTTEYSEGSGDYTEGDYLDEMEPLFEKRVTLHVQDSTGRWEKLGQGDLKFFYNNEMEMGNVTFKQDNEEPKMISALPDNRVEIVSEGKEVTWSGRDYDDDATTSEVKVYKAEFCTKEAAGEFYDVFKELIELSQLCDSSEGED